MPERGAAARRGARDALARCYFLACCEGCKVANDDQTAVCAFATRSELGRWPGLARGPQARWCGALSRGGRGLFPLPRRTPAPHRSLSRLPRPPPHPLRAPRPPRPGGRAMAPTPLKALLLVALLAALSSPGEFVRRRGGETTLWCTKGGRCAGTTAATGRASFPLVTTRKPHPSPRSVGSVCLPRQRRLRGKQRQAFDHRARGEGAGVQC